MDTIIQIRMETGCDIYNSPSQIDTTRSTIDTHSYIHMLCQAHADENINAFPLSLAKLNLAEEMKGATITQTFRDKQKSTLDLLLEGRNKSEDDKEEDEGEDDCFYDDFCDADEVQFSNKNIAKKHPFWWMCAFPDAVTKFMKKREKKKKSLRKNSCCPRMRSPNPYVESLQPRTNNISCIDYLILSLITTTAITLLIKIDCEKILTLIC